MSEARELYDRLTFDVVDGSLEERDRMNRSADRLALAGADGEDVYGVTRGFGPLAQYAASAEPSEQGLNLIHHLSAGQGEPLDPMVTRLMMRLRLHGMTRGFSAVRFAHWQHLADAFNAGFIPVVPSQGSLSASGDLIPLAHAALALSGRGEAWVQGPEGWEKRDAGKLLAELGIAPMSWNARDALAFVNGSSASLATALMNHVRLEDACWISAALTGRCVELLGASAEPYASEVVEARGSLAGHHRASAWILEQLTVVRSAREARQLQEVYSLRCAPQIIGSVWDQLQATGALLAQEAEACSDNPVVTPNRILHAGNFHAINAGLASDHHALLAHQLAFLAERQIAVLVEPATNGGLPALLASSPGATSGLAGVQLAASAMVSEIRQKCTPSTTTSLPTNLSNQDIVPMSLVGGRRVAEQCDLMELVFGSLGITLTQMAHVLGVTSASSVWEVLATTSPRLKADRPLSHEVRAARNTLADASSKALSAEPS